jgi:hypothetical protein
MAALEAVNDGCRFTVGGVMGTDKSPEEKKEDKELREIREEEEEEEEYSNHKGPQNPVDIELTEAEYEGGPDPNDPDEELPPRDT